MTTITEITEVKPGEPGHEVRQGGTMEEATNREKVTWGMFVEAVAIFANDLEIINHPDDPVKTPFEVPEPGKYFLTVSQRLIEMGEQTLLSRLESGQTVLATMCMDRRGAVGTYQALLAEVDRKHPGAQVIILSLGGGAAQEEEVIRPEGVIPDYNRRVALRSIISFIRQNTTALVGELHSVHNGQCGALMYSHNDVSVADRCQVPVCSLAEGVVALDTAHQTIIGGDKLQHPIELLLAHFNFAPGNHEIVDAGLARLIPENEAREAPPE